MKKLTVSRWWPERLRIALCPDRVVVARLGLGLRSRVLDKRSVACENTSDDRPWQAPLAVLGDMLAEFEAPNTTATLILSNHFARYAIVPWRDSVANNAERIGLALHCYKNVYGDMIGGWDIRVSDDGFRRNAIASAVDRDLLTGLDRLFSGRRISLASVQPYFMATYNRFFRQLKPRTSGCLAVLERRRATLGVFDPSGWQALTTRRIADFAPEMLVTLLAQELNSIDLSTPVENLFIAALEDPKFDFTSRDWSTRMLQLKAQAGFSPLTDAHYAMALCGAA